MTRSLFLHCFKIYIPKVQAYLSSQSHLNTFDHSFQALKLQDWSETWPWKTWLAEHARDQSGRRGTTEEGERKGEEGPPALVVASATKPHPPYPHILKQHSVLQLAILYFSWPLMWFLEWRTWLMWLKLRYNRPILGSHVQIWPQCIGSTFGAPCICSTFGSLCILVTYLYCHIAWDCPLGIKS